MRSGGAVSSVVIAFLAQTACSPKTEPPARTQAQQSAPVPPPQLVSLPDVSAMAAPVQEQVRDRYDRLTRAKANLGIAPADLANAYGDLGMLLLAAESFADAEPCLLNAAALEPENGRWSYYIAHVYRLQGKSIDAATWFDRTLTSRPDDVAALVWLGESYLDQGRLDQAEPLFSKAAGLAPRAVAARFGLGRVALARRDYARAIGELEAALALDRRATIVHYPLAGAYRAAGQIERAEAHLRQRGDVEIGPPDPLMEALIDLLRSPVVYESRGDRALARGEFAAAVASFRKGLDLAPDSLSLRQKLATGLTLTGDSPEALQQFQELLRRSPRFAPAHYSLGVLLLSSGQEDRAIEQFSTAVQNDPTYLQARLQLANALRRRGRFEAALREYAEVTARDPRIGEARFGAVLVLAHLERYLDARDRLVEATRLFPEQLEFSNALVRLYAAAPDERVRDATRALALARELVRRAQTLDARETMAMAFAESGQYEPAVKWQREAIATANATDRHDFARRMADNLALYEHGRPCRTPWREDPIWEP
jgi:tetratricopeptide (TPR) repeat protein